MNVNLNKALIYFVQASAGQAGTAPYYIDNLIDLTNSGSPICASADVTFVAAAAAPPSAAYYSAFTSDPYLTPVFNDTFALFNPFYDVVQLTCFGNYANTDAPTTGLLSQCLFPTVQLNGLSLNATLTNSTFTLNAQIDRSSATGNQLNATGIFDANWFAKLSASQTVTASTAEVDSGFGPSLSIATLSWKPWASVTVPTTGYGHWVAVRYHKCASQSGAYNTYKVSIYASFDGAGANVQTLTFNVYGRQRNSGLLVNSPRQSAAKLCSDFVYAYAIDNNQQYNKANVSIDIKAQGDQSIDGSLNIGAVSLTSFSMWQLSTATGYYSMMQSPLLDQASGSKLPAASTTQILGALYAGRIVTLRSSNTNNVDCIGGVTGTNARVDLVAPSGTIIPQYLISWGTGAKSYLNTVVTDGIAGQIRIKVVLSTSVASWSLDIRGYTLNVYNSANTLIACYPIIAATKAGRNIVAPSYQFAATKVRQGLKTVLKGKVA